MEYFKFFFNYYFYSCVNYLSFKIYSTISSSIAYS